jgi:hypothetical protein
MVRPRLPQLFLQSFLAGFLTLLVCAWTVLDGQLGEEVVAHRRLERELGEANTTLHKQSGEHDTLRIAVGLVLNDFEMASELGMSLLAVQVINVMDRAHGMVKRALHLGLQ